MGIKRPPSGSMALDAVCANAGVVNIGRRNPLGAIGNKHPCPEPVGLRRALIKFGPDYSARWPFCNLAKADVCRWHRGRQRLNTLFPIDRHLDLQMNDTEAIRPLLERIADALDRLGPPATRAP